MDIFNYLVVTYGDMWKLLFCWCFFLVYVLILSFFFVVVVALLPKTVVASLVDVSSSSIVSASMKAKFLAVFRLLLLPLLRLAVCVAASAVFRRCSDADGPLVDLGVDEGGELLLVLSFVPNILSRMNLARPDDDEEDDDEFEDETLLLLLIPMGCG